jgi:hypothetical protein
MLQQTLFSATRRKKKRSAAHKPSVRIMQRRANWNPAIVSNAGLKTESQNPASVANDAIAVPITSALNASYPPLDWQNQRRSDLRFSIGVAIALVPAFIALGFSAVAESIMLIG